MVEQRTSVGCGANPETESRNKWAKVITRKRIRYLGIITIREGTEGKLFNIDSDNADYFIKTRPWLDVRFNIFPKMPFFLPTNILALK
ncbi:hypothetical protein HZA76_00925 [Candidatus Roizmanbacteria bacterium]|nr:hypothetical protein [Candidatus Roizmanbacteria bacterium]